MAVFRPFRNADTPALAGLWNHALPDQGVVRPLSPHEFDALVPGKLGFEAAGLIVAERDGRIVGFAHAGFGPVQANGPSHRLDLEMGTVAMLVVEPGLDDVEIERRLILEAERYLRQRGARVFYLGGQNPLNPFYWGLYGGSEFAGILSAHLAFQRGAIETGYQPVATSVLLEADLSRPESRDPRSTLLRRQTRLEISEDALPDGWWQALAIGLFRPTRFELLDRSDGTLVAHAMTWDIASGFAVGDGRSRTGLINLHVASEYRRRGFGRLLIGEVFRHARAQLAELVAVTTSEANTAALGLYATMGFEPVETATLFRLPAELGGRSIA